MDSSTKLIYKEFINYKRKKRIMYKKKYKKSKMISKLYIYSIISLLLLILFACILYKLFFKKKREKNNPNNQVYPQDDLTLVSAYYRVKSVHPYSDYLTWVNNTVLLNKSFVFYTNKEFMPILKEMRPKELYYKTVFIELEIEDFYSYKNFYNELNKSYYIDREQKIHSVPLYLVWTEKTKFVEKAIKKNYFNSKCFYWLDAGYFREQRSEMGKYINSWPTTKKCLEDSRCFMGSIRRFSDEEKQRIINFDISAIQGVINVDHNVAGGFFGGQAENTLKFINFYYDAIRLFIKHKLFIGKDQNAFTYVALSHPQEINLIFWNDDYYFPKRYLS
jgi:hypothetical protein